MPNKKFLEEYPLYRRFRVERMPETANALPKPAINMTCPKCASHQTFVMINEWHELFDYTNPPVRGVTFRALYVCSHCQKFQRVFYIHVNETAQWFMKVGQVPSWEAEGNPNIEKLLGDHAEYYRKGLVCESQGYGIGAYGYYRRIVEETIDELLDEISALISGDDLKRFSEALEKTKKTTVTQEKIDLVKDLLPPILRPDGMNPLSVLHSALSEGLHAESDETCLEHAGVIREILVFLVKQLEDAVSRFEKAWSGSHLGYHARVYYKDFNSPPAGSNFSSRLSGRLAGLPDTSTSGNPLRDRCSEASAGCLRPSGATSAQGRLTSWAATKAL